jgi:hypothetical protein
MLSKLERDGELVGETLEDVNWRIDDFERKHDVYIGHIIRGYHEINEKNKVSVGTSLWYHEEECVCTHPSADTSLWYHKEEYMYTHR